MMDSSQPPLVSVVVPVYNREIYIAATLDSILAQTYRPVEVIVVDDGSTDGSAAVIQSYGEAIRYHYQPNRGMGAALNAGVALAQGEYLAFLDSDDLWPSQKLERQFQAFQAHPEVDMVFGYMQQFISPELDEETRSKILCPPDPQPNYGWGTMLIRREDFERVGPFTLEWHTGVYVEWYLRAEEASLKSLMLPEVLLDRRLHATNIGITHFSDRKEIVGILKKALDRRRGN